MTTTDPALKWTSLFPPCLMEDCAERGRHKHVMDWQKSFIEGSEKYVLVIGGVGSGKTLPANVLCLLLMLAVPGNRGFIGRRTMPKLHDPTLRTFMEVLDRAQIDGVKFYESRNGYPHRIVMPNESEVVFRDTKDLGKHLGPEYGFIYLDEAQEEPEITFNMLTERLRLPQAGQHLKFFMTTNPPHQTHWLAKRFGEPGLKIIGDSAYRVIRVSTRDNKHLPPNYIKDLFANRSEAEIRRIIDGEYGFTPDGEPVYAPPFRNEAHVGLPRLVNAPLIRGWDFGSRHPATTWHQLFRCRYNRPHWTILGELDAQKVTWEQFAVKVVEYTKQMFGEVPASMIVEAGDAAGAAMSDKGPGPIIHLSRPPFRMKFKYKKIGAVLPGINLITEHLRSKCQCGLPWLLIHRRCKHVIDGFAGGYHYPEFRQGTNQRRDEPRKDGFYDDFMDSVRYVGENYLRSFLIDPRVLDALLDVPVIQNADDQARSFAWMGE